MKKNVGITDKIVRFCLIDLFLGFSLAGLEFPLWLNGIFFILSILLTLTIIIGFSPIYSLIGISTKKL